MFKLIHFGFNRRTRLTGNSIRLVHSNISRSYVSNLPLVWSCSESLHVEFLLSNCVFVPISFVYICPLRLSFFVSFFSFCRLSRLCWVPVSQCGLSEMYMLFTVDNLRIGSIDIHTNYDYSIFVFRLDEPIRQSRVRWVPYHCYISVAISLKNIGQKFYLLGESILKTRLFPLWYFRNYYLFALSYTGECIRFASFESRMESRHEDS